MPQRFLTIVAILGSALFLGGAGCVPIAEVQHTGTAAGVRYELTHTDSQSYSFTPRPTGFSYERRRWFGLGRPSLEVVLENGRVLVNNVDRGPIKAGEKLTVTGDSRVLVDDRELGR